MQKTEIIVGFAILLTLTMITSPVYSQIPTREEAEKIFERFLILVEEGMPGSYTVEMSREIIKMHKSPENKEEFIKTWIETEGGKIRPELWIIKAFKWEKQEGEIEVDLLINSSGPWKPLTEEQEERMHYLSTFTEAIDHMLQAPPQSFFEKLRNETSTTIEH